MTAVIYIMNRAVGIQNCSHKIKKDFNFLLALFYASLTHHYGNQYTYQYRY